MTQNKLSAVWKICVVCVCACMRACVCILVSAKLIKKYYELIPNQFRLLKLKTNKLEFNCFIIMTTLIVTTLIVTMGIKVYHCETMVIFSTVRVVTMVILIISSSYVTKLACISR